MRNVGKAHEVYLTMEKCYSDFRKIRVRKLHGWGIMHMDEFVDDDGISHKNEGKELNLNVSYERIPNGGFVLNSKIA